MDINKSLKIPFLLGSGFFFTKNFKGSVKILYFSN